MSKEDKPMDYEDLLDYALELEKQLEEKDQEISELSRTQAGRGRTLKGARGEREADRETELLALETELRTAQEKIEADTLTIKRLQDELSANEAKRQSLQEDKNKADREKQSLSQRIVELEKENVELAKKSQQVETQTKAYNKQKSMTIQMSQQLSDENDSFKDEINELTAKIAQMASEKAQCDSVIARLADERDRLESDRNALDVDKRDLTLRVDELERDIEEVAEKLEASMTNETEWEAKHRALAQQLQTLQEQHSERESSLVKEKEALSQSVTQLRESTQLGQLQRSLSVQNEKEKEREKVLLELQIELQSALQDRDALSERVVELEENIELHVAEKIAGERQKITQLNVALEKEREERASDAEYHQGLELEKEALSRTIDELTHWKASYEAGHGLQTLARTQQKLSDDNRRLSKSLEDQTLKLAQYVDAHNAMCVAFDRLKRECGKSPDFRYPDLELHEEVKSTLAAFQGHIAELEEQLHDLESENVRLRKTLRERQASGVNVASSVDRPLGGASEGEVDLLGESARSRSLIKENQRLRQELAKLQTGVSFPAIDGEVVLNDAFGADIKALLQENATMQQRLHDLHTQLDALVRAQNERGVDVVNAAELERVLAHNNALVLRELDELRRQNAAAAQQVQPAPHTPEHPSDEDGYALRQSALSVPPGELPPTGRTARIRPFSATSQGATLAQTKTVRDRSLWLDLTPTRPATQLAHTNYTNYWTPQMQHAGVFPPQSATYTVPHTPHTPITHRSGSLMMQQMSSSTATPSAAMAATARVPATPAGKALLAQSLHELRLPPEDWSPAVALQLAQLVECLEELRDREREVEEQGAVIAKYDETLSEIRAHMVTMYTDIARKNKAQEEREKQWSTERESLNVEISDLRLKLRRVQEVAQSLQRDDEQALQSRVSELSRKLIVYEVNEAILSRKYISLSEQLKQSHEKQSDTEKDFLEMERLLKERLLFLEDTKHRALSQLSLYQRRLDAAVPLTDYQALLAELETLREDHLQALTREVQHKNAFLQAQEKDQEARSLRIILAHHQSEVVRLQEMNKAREEILLKEREDYEKVVSGKTAENALGETARLVQELARFRGEAARLEVELAAAEKKNALLSTDLQRVCSESDALVARVSELAERERESAERERVARQDLLQLRLTYEGGATREEKEALTLQCESLTEKLSESERACERHQALAEIATQQAQTLQALRVQVTEQDLALREHCARLEARSDDDALVGRLQRRLLALSASYKLFARKYHFARESARKRELESRVLEAALTQRESAHAKREREQSTQRAALRRALLSLKDSLAVSAASQLKKREPPSATQKTAGSGSIGPTSSTGPIGPAAVTDFVAVGFGAKLASLSQEVQRMEALTESATARAAQCERESETLREQCETLQREKELLARQASDLSLVLSATQDETRPLNAPTQHPASDKAPLSHKPHRLNGSGTRRELAARMISLSEESRRAQLQITQQARELQRLREDLGHHKSVLARTERALGESERARAVAELARESTLSERERERERQRRGSEDDERERDEESESDLELDLQRLLQEDEEKEREGETDKERESVKARRLLRRSLSLSHAHTEDTEKAQERERQRDEEINRLRREAQTLSLSLSHKTEREDELRAALRERDDLLSLYERVLREHSLDDVLQRRQFTQKERDGEGENGEQENPSLSLAHTLSRTDRDAQRERRPALLPEQDKLQAAASATIGSLKALLAEKNRLLERYRERVEELTSYTTGLREREKSLAERRADEVIEKLALRDESERDRDRERERVMDERENALTSSVVASLQVANARLSEQLVEADGLLGEREVSLRALEERLAQEVYQRERAERRCGDALHEMDALQSDMRRLYEELHDTQQRLLHVTQGHRVQVTVEGGEMSEESTKLREATPVAKKTPQRETERESEELREMENRLRATEKEREKEQKRANRRVAELERQLHAKDEKVRNYRDIVVRLKEEFLKVEEQRATETVREKFAATPAQGGVSAEELRDFKEKITSLREGLKTANSDLDKAKRAREKEKQEKTALQEQNAKLDEAQRKAEAQLVAAQNAVQRLRRDLEESRKKETRLREKLKEFLAKQETQQGKKEKEKEREPTHTALYTKERVTELEKEVQLLRAQNTLLRRAESVDRRIERDMKTEGYARPAQSDVEKHLKAKKDAQEEEEEQKERDRGHVLGTGREDTATQRDGSPLTDARTQAQHRWESEKRFQRRITVLEARVKELSEENDALRHKTVQLRENVTSAATAREQLQKRLQDGALRGKASAAELTELAEAQERVFALEEEVQALKRRSEVDQENQIRQLRHKLSQAEQRVVDLETELGETREKTHKYLHSNTPSSKNAALRDSEERFLRSERLAEEVETLRRQRLELETMLLERESARLESRFELESAQQEVLRLRRRVGELDALAVSLRKQQQQQQGVGGGGGGVGMLSTSPFTTTNTAPTAPTGVGGGGGGRREAELEEVVSSLRKVVERLRGENERLRRNAEQPQSRERETSAERERDKPAQPVQDKDKEKDRRALQSERQKTAKLQSEVAELTRSRDELQSKLSSRAQQLSALRQTLKTREDELQRLRERLRGVEEEKTSRTTSPTAVEDETEMQRDRERLAALRKELSVALAERDVLQGELAELRRKTDAKILSESLSRTRPGGEEDSAAVSVLREEVSQLKSENSRLKQELSAFDLDFFEEIENLKFAHAQAVRKLRMYEQSQR